MPSKFKHPFNLNAPSSPSPRQPHLTTSHVLREAKGYEWTRGPRQFTAQGCSQTAAASWFLGTRRPGTTRSVQIRITANGRSVKAWPAVDVKTF